MSGIVRQSDTHAGHFSPTPNPYHKTSYIPSKNSSVYINNRLGIVKGDKTGCGDPAIGSSPNVYFEGIKVHRLYDSTGGHGSWVPNYAASSSGNVFANGE